MCDLCQNMTVCKKRQTLAGRYCSIAPAGFWLSGPNSIMLEKVLALYGKTSAISANLFFERRTARLTSIFSVFSESWLVFSRRFIIFKFHPWFSLFSILQCLGKERVTVLTRRSPSRGLGTPKVKYCVGPSSRFDKQQNIKINCRKRVYNLLVRIYLNLWSCFITHQSKCVTQNKIEFMRD